MATNADSPKLLDLPDDILLEILALLPVPLVVLRCRPLCRKLDRLSRESHLWIKYFHQTKHTLRRPTDLKQIGTPELEINICRAEALEENLGNEGADWVAPRFWRGCLNGDSPSYAAVVIMGDYIVGATRRESYDWFSIHDMDGPPVYTFPNSSLGAWVKSCMDYATGTLYLFSPSERSLKVVGIQADHRGPHVATEFSLPLSAKYTGGCFVQTSNGFVLVRYHPFVDGRDIDIADLRRRTISWFTVPPLPQPFMPPVYSIRRPIPEVFATENHLICLPGQSLFAIFKRPTTASSQGVQQPNTDGGSAPPGNTRMDLALKGGLPWFIDSNPTVIPRSASTFVMVVLRGGARKIHVLLFTLLEAKSAVEEIFCVDMPGGFNSFTLPPPPVTSRFAFGIVGATPETDDVHKGGSMYFALRIDFPDTEQNLATGNRGRLAWRRMNLTPAIDMLEEKYAPRCFDYFSGRVWFTTFSAGGQESEVILDYLSASSLSS